MMKFFQLHALPVAGRLVSVISVFLLMFMLAAPASAQNGKVFFSEKRTTAGHIANEIQKQTGYIFAFESRTFDTGKTVNLPASALTVKEALDAMASDTGYTYIIRGGYVVINSLPKDVPAREPQTAKQRTGDTYSANDPNALDGRYSRRPVQQQQQQQEPVAAEDPVVVQQLQPAPEYPEPYSAYSDPDIYGDIQWSLPSFQIKTNLLYGAVTLTPNVALEIGLTPNSSLEMGGSWNQWNYRGTAESNRKLNHFILRPEYRYWFCERFNGHFLGVHAFYGKYNISEYNIPTLFEKEYRYEGSVFGAGITYGYQLMLGTRWSLEFHVGVGVAQLTHKRFKCGVCSDIIDNSGTTYFGPTRAGVSIVYLIK